MGMGVSGGDTTQAPAYKDARTEKLAKAIVVEDVKIVEKVIEIEVPRIKDVIKEQVVYKDIPASQIKYLTSEVPNVKYVTVEEQTTRFKVVEEPTIKYIPKEQVVEKPVIQEKVYEKPVLKEVEYTVVRVSDIELMKEACQMLPGLVDELQAVKKKLQEVVKYNLVEKELQVPKILYIPTEVERIVWRDVVRERPGA